jgi:hypothetical protein
MDFEMNVVMLVMLAMKAILLLFMIIIGYGCSFLNFSYSLD